MTTETMLMAAGGNGGGGRRKTDNDDSYDLGVLSGKVDSLEKSVDNLTKSVSDSSSEIAVLRTTMAAMQEGIKDLNKTVSDEFKKLIEVQSDGWMRAFRDSLRQDALIRRAFWGIVILIFASTTMTVSIRLFGKDAVDGGTEAVRSLKKSQREMVGGYIPEAPK